MTVHSIQVRDAHAGRRGNAYYVLARLLQPPKDWADGLPEIVRAAFHDFPDPLPTIGERLASRMEEAGEDVEALEIGHARLMFGPFEVLVAPWASFYLEEAPRLMGPTSQYAASAYAEAGLAPDDNLRDAPDHVTHELEFMYFLAFKAATEAEPVWSERQQRFWRDHLGRWLPAFADAVLGTDVDSFYHDVAEALLAFVVLEDEALDSVADSKGDSPDDR